MGALNDNLARKKKMDFNFLSLYMVEGAFNKTFTNDCIIFDKKHLAQDLFKVSLNIEKPSKTIGS